MKEGEGEGQGGKKAVLGGALQNRGWVFAARQRRVYLWEKEPKKGNWSKRATLHPRGEAKLFKRGRLRGEGPCAAGGVKVELLSIRQGVVWWVEKHSVRERKGGGEGAGVTGWKERTFTGT